MGKDNVKDKPNFGRPRIIIIIMAFVLLIGLSFWYLTAAVNDKIIASNIVAMEELSLHDLNSIRNSIVLRWDNMEGVAKDISHTEFKNSDDLLMAMKARTADIPSATKMSFLDSEGNNILSTGVVEKGSYLAEVCKGKTERFVIRLNTDVHFRENIHEILLEAVPVNFSVGSEHFEWMICQFPISTLEKELKISSYGGEGYSSVIDTDGNYIINMSRGHSFLTFDNFFSKLQNAKVKGYRDIYDLCAVSEESKSAIYKLDGNENIMVVTPVDVADWLFISTVPISVFDAQTRAISGLFFVLLGILALVLAAVCILILRQKNQQAELMKKEETDALNVKLQEQQVALEEALALAQSASRAKTTFLNNMSHDIRTPMNAIIGYTGLASSHIDNKEQVRDYLYKIGQSSNHLLSLINDVLDMSRIESGKVTIEEKDEDLGEILHTLRNIVQADINSKQLDFFMDTDIRNEFVKCDKMRLNQVLLNILSNSIKYTQPGGMVSVRLKETGKSESGYGKYEFRIKDNGIGMSEEYLKTIFDPFTRAKSSTVSGIQGTGLGMAITKNIVDMMGGTISILSKEGEGTETILTFDFKHAEGNREPVRIAELQGLKSLVVDDDVSACQHISDMLRDVGMRSDWCTSGKEAVIRTEEAVRHGETFKVYVIDWMMPDMNGIETTRRIRKIIGNQAPIIVLTAYDWADIEEEAREAGVTAFVSKPLFPSDLQKVLNKCCISAAESNVPEEKAYNFTGRKILLVEDNEMNREIATEILEEEGFVIDTAEDGTVAVEKMKAAKPGQYDLILMDVQMPVMNGYEATKAIRALPDPEIANITILAMTANAFEEDRQEALKAGMNEHLSKPVEIDKLKAMLVRFLIP